MAKKVKEKKKALVYSVWIEGAVAIPKHIASEEEAKVKLRRIVQAQIRKFEQGMLEKTEAGEMEIAKGIEITSGLTIED